MEKPDRFWALKTHIDQARRKVKEIEEETRVRSYKVKCLGSVKLMMVPMWRRCGLHKG